MMPRVAPVPNELDLAGVRRAREALAALQAAGVDGLTRDELLHRLGRTEGLLESLLRLVEEVVER